MRNRIKAGRIGDFVSIPHIHGDCRTFAQQPRTQQSVLRLPLTACAALGMNLAWDMQAMPPTGRHTMQGTTSGSPMTSPQEPQKIEDENIPLHDRFVLWMFLLCFVFFGVILLGDLLSGFFR
jgi:hypothetical protein